MMTFTGITERNGYNCNSVRDICIFLHINGTPVSWKELESTYEIFESQMSEIFWEMAVLVCDMFDYSLNLRPNFLRHRAHLCVDGILNQGSPLNNVDGFIVCNKIRLCQSSGHLCLKRAVYKGDKQMPC